MFCTFILNTPLNTVGLPTCMVGLFIYLLSLVQLRTSTQRISVISFNTQQRTVKFRSQEAVIHELQQQCNAEPTL